MLRKLRRQAIVSALLTLAMIAAGSAPALGFHDPAPLLDERHIEGPFWVAYRVAVEHEDSIVGYELANPTSENREQVAYGLWTMRVGQTKPHFFVVGSGGTRTTEAQIRWDEPAPVDTDVDPVVGSTGETNGYGLTHRDLAPGDYWLVVASTSPWQTSANVRLFGSEGVRLLETAQGDEGTLLRETDFETNDPHHHVRTGAVTVTAQTHELRNAHIDYSIDNSMFGIFSERGGDPGDVDIIQPDGSERPEGVMSGLPPGDYRFRVNEWVVPPRAAPGPDAYIALLIADVALPERDRTPSALEVSVTPDGAEVAMSATLTSSDGAPLAGRSIEFAWSEEERQAAVTNDQGVATLVTSRGDARPGETITATFLGDETHEPSSSTTTVPPR